MKIISVVGARPNFMKIAPIHRAFQNLIQNNNSIDLKHMICHTGQHYDENMSKVFFNDLELPEPDFYLGVGSSSHAKQTAQIMIEFEKILLDEKPELVIVVGDVNSTLACSLTAVKLGIKVAHIEAGLRSFDRTMPEEINRILTDSISDFLFVTEKSGIINLRKEGIDDSKIFFVGNTMIDSLLYYLPKSELSKVLTTYNVDPQNYILITLHRPSNVDDKVQLSKLIDFINTISKKKKIIFPIHPRTKNNIFSYGLNRFLNSNIVLIEPLGYIDFLALIKNAALIITDSGGLQEESTFLNIPCITLRKSTERPVTVEIGTNQLFGDNFNGALDAVNEILNGNIKKGNIPEFWDGKAAKRIVKILIKKLSN